MRTAIIAFTAQGGTLGRHIADGLGHATLHVPARLSQALGEAPYPSLSQWVAEQWAQVDSLVFIGATGIAVRAIAAHVNDKFCDPCVIVLDERGQFVISLLSGHVGGGNALTQTIANLTGGQAVISTATDVNGKLSIDVWAKEHGLHIGSREMAKTVSATLLDGKAVGFASDCGYPCPKGLTDQILDLGVWVSANPDASPFGKTLPLIPKTLTLGIGCRRGTSQEAIETAVGNAMGTYAFEAVYQVASIDLKQDEAGLLAFCQTHHLPFITYTAQQLQAVLGDFTPSAFVASVTGVDNVCERSAVLAGGTLIVPKYAHNGVTVAVAQTKE
ncbi:cobalt-precorrin 5A hydrolase [Bengtsoniella intestinalis]|uniref:cobalt-precorrin 5A hydrolase n=1 Tax=Bengtsoniella intestinalis TaxID=3073143 RepID=UPI00391F11FD